MEYYVVMYEADVPVAGIHPDLAHTQRAQMPRPAHLQLILCDKGEVNILLLDADGDEYYDFGYSTADEAFHDALLWYGVPRESWREV